MKNLTYVIFFLLTSCAENKSFMSIPKNESIVFVGTYTKNMGWVNGKAKGIYTCRLKNTTGELTVIDSTTDIQNPSFLTISPDKKFLYAVAENGGNPQERFGSIVAYKILEGFKLLKINEVPSYGAAPCFVSMDSKGKFVFVANYSTGNIASYGVKADGGLTDTICMKKNEGKGGLAHQIFEAPDKASVVVVDKGLDKIIIYGKTIDGILTAKTSVSTAAGAGPRHFDFAPNKKIGYAINELNSTINTYAFDASTSQLTELQSLSTLPIDVKGQNTCAEIFVHPNGRFVYGSNRGHNSIAVFKIKEDGTLMPLGHEPTQGKTPRFFMITPDGRLLLVANQNSDNVVAFSIDASSGKLTPTGKNNRIMTPVCLKMY
jgi:6-phosphogluconolactonase